MAQSLKKFDFDVVPAIAREVVQVDSGSIDDVIKAFLGDIPKDVITSYQTGGRNVLPKINWKLVRTTFSKIVATKRDAVAKSIYCEQQLIQTREANASLRTENEQLQARIQELQNELANSSRATYDHLDEIDADEEATPSRQENIEDMIKQLELLNLSMNQSMNQLTQQLTNVKLERDSLAKKNDRIKEKLGNIPFNMKAWILLGQYAAEAKQYFYSKYKEYCQAHQVTPEYSHMSELIRDNAQRTLAKNWLVEYNMPLATLALLEEIKDKRNRTALTRFGPADVRAAAEAVLAPEERERIVYCLTRYVVQ